MTRDTTAKVPGEIPAQLHHARRSPSRAAASGAVHPLDVDVDCAVGHGTAACWRLLMPKKNRARKNATRRAQQRTGASYTSDRAGTTHSHPAPNMGLLTELPYVQGHELILEQAAALVGAC